MHANNIDQVTKRWEYAGSDAFTEVRVVVELIISCMYDVSISSRWYKKESEECCLFSSFLFFYVVVELVVLLL